MKKILHVSKYMYPFMGGVELVVQTMTSALKNEAIEQKIICFNENASDNDYICKRNVTTHEYVGDVEIIRCGCFGKVASQSLSFIYHSELGDLMKNFKPNIVIFHYPNPLVASYLLQYKKYDFKLILFWHFDITKQKILGKLFYNQSIELLERANVIISTSPNYVNGSPFLQKYKDKCVIIPVCIEHTSLEITKEIQKKAESIRKRLKGKTICFGLGRHIPYKGFKYLIEAFKYLDDNFKLYIGGQGPLTKKLIKQAKNNPNIIFLGKISNEEKIIYYLVCDIFCFPSITKNEAFGLALAEGMYFGKPAVTFNIPGSGVNYVNLDNVTGIECPNRDVKAYARAIKKLATDKKLASEYGENAKARVVENFMFDKFKRKIVHLIEKF